jgi:ketosteroid isomerase-like protein
MDQRGSCDPSRGDAQASSKTWGRLRTALAVWAAILLVLSSLLVAVGCGDDSLSETEAVVQRFFTAMENKDIDGVFDVFDPNVIASMEAEVAGLGLTQDDLKSMFVAELFTYDSIEFSEVKLESRKTGDGEAVVTVVGGTVTQTVDGVTETLDAADFSGSETEIDLYEVDGKWYIDFESM